MGVIMAFSLVPQIPLFPETLALERVAHQHFENDLHSATRSRIDPGLPPHIQIKGWRTLAHTLLQRELRWVKRATLSTLRSIKLLFRSP